MTTRTPLLAILLLATAANGQSLYVSDELVITVRTGPSTTNQIVTNLRSGDLVEILEVDEELGYSLIRAGDGTEGWVVSRYLSEQPIARDRLSAAEQALSQARDRITDLEQQLETLSAGLESATQRLEDTDAANTAMSAELSDIRNASANTLALRDSNTSLRRSLNERDQQVEQLVLENRSLRNGAVREWFVVGAGVLLGGIVIGLVLPSLRRKRSSGW